MRRILIRSAILIVTFAALLLLWIFAGRGFSLLLDRFATGQLESRPVHRVVYDGNESGGVLEIAGFPLSARGRDGRSFPLTLRTNAQHQLVLSLGGKFFELDPKSGETVSLSIRRSLLNWPTPFDFNFMTGHSPSWKRNLYYVLDWRKASGQRLEMVWRYEQYFYPVDGWASGFMMREGATGLIRVKISP